MATGYEWCELRGWHAFGEWERPDPDKHSHRTCKDCGHTHTFTPPTGKGPKFIDHRELLVKYIYHVGDCEGVSFIGGSRHWENTIFTEAEWNELIKLDRESEEIPLA